MDEVPAGAVIGIGSGSTVAHFIALLGESAGRIAGAVSSSERSSQLLRDAGVPVLELGPVLAAGKSIPVYVDGADEIDDRLRMIKGGGGALTREKIVAAASERFVCIVDASKVVSRLGSFPLPVEVVPMAAELVSANLRRIGGQPAQRKDFITDNGNLVLDTAGLSIDDPVALETEINQWPGVVTVGLFARRPADIAYIASPDGVRRKA